MEAGTLALIRAGAGRQVCQRFAYLGGNESDWHTIRGEIERDFRGHPAGVYDELIAHSKAAYHCANFPTSGKTVGEISELISAILPQVRPT